MSKIKGGSFIVSTDDRSRRWEIYFYCDLCGRMGHNKSSCRGLDSEAPRLRIYQDARPMQLRHSSKPTASQVRSQRRERQAERARRNGQPEPRLRPSQVKREARLAQDPRLQTPQVKPQARPAQDPRPRAPQVKPEVRVAQIPRPRNPQVIPGAPPSQDPRPNHPYEKDDDSKDEQDRNEQAIKSALHVLPREQFVRLSDTDIKRIVDAVVERHALLAAQSQASAPAPAAAHAPARASTRVAPPAPLPIGNSHDPIQNAPTTSPDVNSEPPEPHHHQITNDVHSGEWVDDDDDEDSDATVTPANHRSRSTRRRSRAGQQHHEELQSPPKKIIKKIDDAAFASLLHHEFLGRTAIPLATKQQNKVRTHRSDGPDVGGNIDQDDFRRLTAALAKSTNTSSVAKPIAGGHDGIPPPVGYVPGVFHESDLGLSQVDSPQQAPIQHTNAPPARLSPSGGDEATHALLPPTKLRKKPKVRLPPPAAPGRFDFAKIRSTKLLRYNDFVEMMRESTGHGLDPRLGSGKGFHSRAASTPYSIPALRPPEITSIPSFSPGSDGRPIVRLPSTANVGPVLRMPQARRPIANIPQSLLSDASTGLQGLGNGHDIVPSPSAVGEKDDEDLIDFGD